VLRKLDKADFTRAREFRRHVTMTADVGDKSMIVNIDIIHEYFEKTKELVKYVKELVAE